MESIDTHRIGEARDIGQIAQQVVARLYWPGAFEADVRDDHRGTDCDQDEYENAPQHG